MVTANRGETTSHEKAACCVCHERSVIPARRKLLGKLRRVPRAFYKKSARGTRRDTKARTQSDRRQYFDNATAIDAGLGCGDREDAATVWSPREGWLGWRARNTVGNALPFGGNVVSPLE